MLLAHHNFMHGVTDVIKLGNTGAEWSLVTSYSCQVSWKSFTCFVIMRKGQMYGHGNTRKLSSRDVRF